ncbi:GntR family transcriptional regulator [Frondihabitans australicus]|uniref:DNA-binding GntR family transcriptional regulator n=1 Tax=Frondihabitans australicus TaxID=386892 RepID=A0A495IKS5_9MICO|nr:GntR family transcriptional regulator [Frondihabitans australicus]RKR75725.1 DNA-binding GntR family transcriptional regulator [Frondihabitans australicus]
MPVPVPNPETQEPRRLLRDVVYEKMFEAIIDGTLELGERLNDDELVRWLGVSRTPVREAIARLAEYGLVDIEANRYTRVVAPSYAEFLDTVHTGYELWSMFVRTGVPALNEADRAFVADVFDKRAAVMDKEGREDIFALSEANNRLLAASGSPIMTRVWAITGPIVALLFQRTGAVGIFPWKEGASFSRDLRDAIKKGDGEKAGDLVAAQPARFGAYLDAVKESGIFPA